MSRDPLAINLLVQEAYFPVGGLAQAGCSDGSGRVVASEQAAHLEKWIADKVNACDIALMTRTTRIAPIAPIVAIALLRAVFADADAGGDRARKCAATVTKAANEKICRKLECYRRAANAGTPVNPGCLADADAKFVAAVLKAERKGGCLVNADGLGGAVERCVSEIVGGPSTTVTISSTTTTSTESTSTTSTSVPACPPSAGAPAVTFSELNDAVAGRFFDAAASVVDGADPNVLVLGLDSGLDPDTLKFRDFKASLLPFSYPAAADTFSLVIHAPCGYAVARVTYDEIVVLEESRTGRAFATTQLVVNERATEAKTVDLSGQGATEVRMSIFTSLVAANANAEVSSGRVVVELAPLPVTP